MENVKRQRDIKLATTEVRRGNLVSEPNYHTAIFFKDLLATEMKIKTQMFMNKSFYLGLSILEISKIAM